MNKELKKWVDSVQIDEGVKALSDIKIFIERFYERGYEGDWEILKLIEEIETRLIYVVTIDKIKNISINEIGKIIKQYYELVGRSEESYSVGTFKPKKMETLKKIEEVLNKAKIPSKYLVISRLK